MSRIAKTPTKPETVPLHGAAATGNTRIIEMQIKKGANLEATNRMRERPLRAATARNSLGAVQLLIHQGAKTDCRDGEGEDSVACSCRVWESGNIATSPGDLVRHEFTGPTRPEPSALRCHGLLTDCCWRTAGGRSRTLSQDERW
jgi:ankyrin repeat protein